MNKSINAQRVLSAREICFRRMELFRKKEDNGRERKGSSPRSEKVGKMKTKTTTAIATATATVTRKTTMTTTTTITTSR
jgi:hypothetical protein